MKKNKSKRILSHILVSSLVLSSVFSSIFASQGSKNTNTTLTNQATETVIPQAEGRASSDVVSPTTTTKKTEFTYQEFYGADKGVVDLLDPSITPDSVRDIIFAKQTEIFDNLNSTNVSDFTITKLSKNYYDGILTVPFTVSTAQPANSQFTITISGFTPVYSQFKASEFPYGDSATSNKQAANKEWVVKTLKAHQADMINVLPEDYNLDNIECVDFNTTTDLEMSVKITLPNTKASADGTVLSQVIKFTNFASNTLSLKQPSVSYELIWGDATPATSLLDAKITKQYFQAGIANAASKLFNNLPSAGITEANVVFDNTSNINYAKGEADLSFTLSNAPEITTPFKLKITGFVAAPTKVKQGGEFPFGVSTSPNTVATKEWFTTLINEKKLEMFENVPSDYDWTNNLQISDAIDTSVVGKASTTVTLANTQSNDAKDPLVSKITITGFLSEGLTTDVTPGRLNNVENIVPNTVTPDSEELKNAIATTRSIITGLDPERPAITNSDITIDRIVTFSNTEGSVTVDLTIAAEKAWVNGKHQAVTKNGIKFTGFKIQNQTTWAADDIPAPEEWKNLYANELTLDTVRPYLQAHPELVASNLPDGFVGADDLVVSQIQPLESVDAKSGKVWVKVGLKKYYNEQGLLQTNDGTINTKQFNIVGLETRFTALSRDPAIFQYNEIWSGDPIKLSDPTINKKYLVDAINKNKDLIFTDAPDSIDVSNVNQWKINKNVATGSLEISFYLTNAKPISSSGLNCNITIQGFVPLVTELTKTKFIDYGDINIPSAKVDDQWVKNKVIEKQNDMFVNLPKEKGFVLANNLFIEHLNNTEIGQVTFTLRVKNVYVDNPERELVQSVTFAGFKTKGITTSIKKNTNDDGTVWSGGSVAGAGYYATEISDADLRNLIAKSDIIENVDGTAPLLADNIRITQAYDKNDITGSMKVDFTVLKARAWQDGKNKDMDFNNIIVQGFEKRTPTAFVVDKTITDTTTFRNIYANEFKQANIQQYVFDHQSKFFSNAPTLTLDDIFITSGSISPDRPNGIVRFRLALKKWYNNTDGRLSTNDEPTGPDSFANMFELHGFDTRDTSLRDGKDTFTYSEIWNTGEQIDLDDPRITPEFFSQGIANKFDYIFDQAPDTCTASDVIITPEGIIDKNPALGTVTIKLRLANARPTAKDFTLHFTGFKQKITNVKNTIFNIGDPTIPNTVDAGWVKQRLIEKKNEVFENLPNSPTFKLSNQLYVDNNLNTSVVGEVGCNITLNGVFTEDGGPLKRTITIRGFKTTGLVTTVPPVIHVTGFEKIYASDIDPTTDKNLIKAIVNANVITGVEPVGVDDIKLSAPSAVNDKDGSLTLTITIINKKGWDGTQPVESLPKEGIVIDGFKTREPTKWVTNRVINDSNILYNIYADQFNTDDLLRYVTGKKTSFFTNAPTTFTDSDIVVSNLNPNRAAGELTFDIGLRLFYDPTNALLTRDDAPTPTKFTAQFKLTGFDTRDTTVNNHGVFNYAQFSGLEPTPPTLDKASDDFFKDLITKNPTVIFNEGPKEITLSDITEFQPPIKNVALGTVILRFTLNNARPAAKSIQFTIQGFSTKVTSIKSDGTFPLGNPSQSNKVDEPWIRRTIIANKSTIFENLPENYDLNDNTKMEINFNVNEDTKEPNQIKFMLTLNDVFTANKKPLVKQIIFTGFRTDGNTTIINNGKLLNIENTFASSLNSSSESLKRAIISTPGIIQYLFDGATITTGDIALSDIKNVNDKTGSLTVTIEIVHSKAQKNGFPEDTMPFVNKTFTGFNKREPTTWVDNKTVNDPSFANYYADQYTEDKIRTYVFANKLKFFINQPNILTEKDIVIVNPIWNKKAGSIEFTLRLTKYYDTQTSILETGNTPGKVFETKFTLTGFNNHPTAIVGQTFQFGVSTVPAGLADETWIRNKIKEKHNEMFNYLPENYRFTPENVIISNIKIGVGNVSFNLVLNNVNVVDEVANNALDCKRVTFTGFKNQGLVNTSIKPTFTDPNPTSLSINYEQLSYVVGDRDKLFAVDWLNDIDNPIYGLFVVDYVNQNIANILDGVSDEGIFVTATACKIEKISNSSNDFNIQITFNNWFVNSVPEHNKIITGKLTLKGLPFGEKFEGGIEEEIKKKMQFIDSVQGPEKIFRIKEIIASYLTSRQDELPNTFISSNEVQTSQITCTATFDKEGSIILRDLQIHEAMEYATDVDFAIKIKFLKIDPRSMIKDKNSSTAYQWAIIGVVGAVSLILLTCVASLISKTKKSKKQSCSFVGEISE